MRELVTRLGPAGSPKPNLPWNLPHIRHNNIGLTNSPLEPILAPKQLPMPQVRRRPQLATI